MTDKSALIWNKEKSTVNVCRDDQRAQILDEPVWREIYSLIGVCTLNLLYSCSLFLHSWGFSKVSGKLNCTHLKQCQYLRPFANVYLLGEKWWRKKAISGAKKKPEQPSYFRSSWSHHFFSITPPVKLLNDFFEKTQPNIKRLAHVGSSVLRKNVFACCICLSVHVGVWACVCVCVYESGCMLLGRGEIKSVLFAFGMNTSQNTDVSSDMSSQIPWDVRQRSGSQGEQRILIRQRSFKPTLQSQMVIYCITYCRKKKKSSSLFVVSKRKVYLYHLKIPVVWCRFKTTVLFGMVQQLTGRLEGRSWATPSSLLVFPEFAWAGPLML